MPTKDLAWGMRGPDVLAVQQALNALNPKKKIDENGIFGPQTDRAVRDYQKQMGLKEDGIVGWDTRHSLFPLEVATVVIYATAYRTATPAGMRLRSPGPRPLGPTDQISMRRQFPNLMAGHLHLDYSLMKRFIAQGLALPHFAPLRLWGLKQPLAAPMVPSWNVRIPRAPTSGDSPQLGGFVYDHVELIPGGQATFPGFRGSLTDLSVWQFIWTLQTVFVSGPPEGKHIELVPGFQFGRPLLHFADDGTLWIYSPFVQVTDVDRLGALGHFHWWGPYAQVGAQALTPGYGQPAATFNLFPVNLQYDVNDVLTLQLAAGIAGTLDLNTGRLTAGPQVQFGLNFKLGRLRSGWLPPDPSR